MQRIPFLDYTRVFACFLVMLVHACEFYYPISMTETMLADNAFGTSITRCVISRAT